MRRIRSRVPISRQAPESPGRSCHRTDDCSSRRAGGRVQDDAAVERDARHAAARRGARRSEDSVDARDARACVFRPPSFELRVRGSFSAKGERVYAGTPRALPPCATTWRSTAYWPRWLVDPNNPRSSRGPSIASGNSSSGVGWSRRARISVHRGPADVPNCSTGCDGIRRKGMEPEGPGADHRPVVDVSPVVGHAGCRR